MADENDRRLNGSFDNVVGIQERCFPAELIEMQRTDELWVKRKVATALVALL